MPQRSAEFLKTQRLRLSGGHRFLRRCLLCCLQPHAAICCAHCAHPPACFQLGCALAIGDGEDLLLVAEDDGQQELRRSRGYFFAAASRLSPVHGRRSKPTTAVRCRRSADTCCTRELEEEEAPEVSEQGGRSWSFPEPEDAPSSPPLVQGDVSQRMVQTGQRDQASSSGVSRAIDRS